MVFSLLNVFFIFSFSWATTVKTIAITQIIDHPALNQEKEGILLALKKAGYEEGKNLKLLFENAQGSIITASQIATKFASLKPDVVMAISTPSAQTLIRPLKRVGIPMVFSAVTDPLGGRIISNNKSRKEAITGVCDAMSSSWQLKHIKKNHPNIKNIGTIYNPGEANSVNSIKELETQAKNFKIKLWKAPASNTSEVKSAANSLASKIQAYLILTDNTAVAAMPSIISVGKQQKIPVYASDTGSIQNGAESGMVYNRYKLGKKAGKMIVKILSGTYAGDIAIAMEHTPELMEKI